MKVRVTTDAKDPDCYNVEAKRWYWPFWMEVSWSYNKDAAIQRAKYLTDPELSVVWKNYD